MASIIKRNNNFCVVYSYKDANGTPKQKWETFTDLSDAKNRKKEVEYKESVGTFVVPQCKTLNDLLPEYVALYGKSKWALSTYQANTALIANIRLTELIPELLDMVDEKKIAFNPAVEISYLKPNEQQDFLEAMDYAQSTPSLSQAQRLKKFSQEGKCSLDAMCAIMSEEKKGELDRVTIKHDVLRKYFPKSYTPKQMEDTIIKLLEQWQRKREKSMER